MRSRLQRTIALLLLCSGFLFAQTSVLDAKDSALQMQWVDSVYRSMTLEQRVGQLMVVFTDSKSDDFDRIKELIDNYTIGGLLFSVGTPEKQLELTNAYQKISEVPLLITMDAEWGLAMRLSNSFAFPYAMTLGASNDTALVRQIGARVGAHARRIGVHMNFAPVVDLNTNPSNPIIGNRSFGSDPDRVSKLASAFYQGMWSEGVMGSIKHFPGHGDTATDSHLTLPVVKSSRRELDSLELKPFRHLIRSGVHSVMIAHLALPNIVSAGLATASLSKQIGTALLQDELGFEGLVITDALNMKGVSAELSPEEVVVAAFNAGADILLYPLEVGKSIDALLAQIRNGSISEARLEQSVKNILKAKYVLGLNKWSNIDTVNLSEDLKSTEDQILKEEVFESAITVFDADNRLPAPVDKSYAYLSLSGDSAEDDPFFLTLSRYAHIRSLPLEQILEQVSTGTVDAVILSHTPNTDTPWKNTRFNRKALEVMKVISDTSIPVILAHFGSPYALADLDDSLKSVVLGYQSTVESKRAAAQVIFGALAARGRLPVRVNDRYDLGDGVRYPAKNMLTYSAIPERVGLSSRRLAAVDTLIQELLLEGMAPGGQLLVARSGKVVFERNFGYLNPKKKDSVKWNTIYDVASITKIAASLPLIMRAQERGEIGLGDRFSDWFNQLKGTEIGETSLISALSHNGRLPAWIPFYKETLDTNGKPIDSLYSNINSETFSIPVSRSLYLKKDYPKVMFERIARAKLESKKYRYSDLPYYLIWWYFSDRYGAFDRQIDQFLYQPMGLTYTSFNPYKVFDLENIAPTEIDDYFRYNELQGYVHDMGAAMLGGVAGHAGLFSNANDMAKLMQLYLQGGEYGKKRYLNSETIRRFNTCYYCHQGNRRGVGFDKPQLEGEGSTCGCVSSKSFGHLGFTGTYVWADPEAELVYVFLSNRTYPDMDNNLLGSSNMRTRIQKAIYDARLD